MFQFHKRRWRISSVKSLVIAWALTIWFIGFFQFKDNWPATHQVDSGTVPTIYVVTPTYARPTQMADLTRLAQTLMLVSDIHWIVVEDSNYRSRQVSELLFRSKAQFTHLFAKTPNAKKNRQFGKGVTTRLKALRWLREQNKSEGVIYFADDDNAYDVRVFKEMRWTKKVSVWPVGLINVLGISTPLVKDGKVIGFHDPLRGRQFMIDMAGFAVSMDLWIRNPNATFPYRVQYLEDHFLRGLNITIHDMEPMAKNCTEVLVWHTKTVPGKAPSEKYMKNVTNYSETNLPDLYSTLLSGMQ